MNGIMNALKASPAGNFMNMMALYNQMKNNPMQIGQILYDHGRINSDQLEEIQKLNGNTAQIGQYLLNSGALDQAQYTQYQKALPQLRGMIK